MTITPDAMEIDEDRKPRHMVFSKVGEGWVRVVVVAGRSQLSRS